MYARVRRNRMSSVRRADGFSMPEMIITMVIMAAILAIAVPLYQNSLNRSRASATRNSLVQIEAIIVKVRDQEESTIGDVFLNPPVGTGFATYDDVDMPCRTMAVLPRATQAGFDATPCGITWNKQIDIISQAFNRDRTEVRSAMIDAWNRPILIRPLDGENTKVRTSPTYWDVTPGQHCNQTDYAWSRGKDGKADVNAPIPPLTNTGAVVMEITKSQYGHCSDYSADA